MAEFTPSRADTTAPTRFGNISLVWALVPLLLLGVMLALLVVTGAGLGRRTAPPIEELSIDRITLPAPDQIVLEVTNGGADQVTIAQVQVDDAYWSFAVQPAATVPRLGRATITVPYPWVQDDVHAIRIVSANGVTFDGEVPVATQTPRADLNTVLRYTLLGIYVGVIPVGLGLLWYPFLRRLGRAGMQAILSLTVGLLVFLLVDTLAEALELIAGTPGVFGGTPLVWLVALIAFGALIAVGARHGSAGTSRLGIAYRIALGIGLHNLGEGLAIGAAFASGEAALGAFLVIGFTLHNITEGIGIAAPISRERVPFRQFVLLALLAGGPAIVGVWIGGFVFNQLLAAVFLALGAGAIAQVIYEVSRLLLRQSREDQVPALNWPVFGGFVAGVVIMYATALLVPA